MRRQLHDERYFLWPEEVAEMLMLRLETVHALIASGELPSICLLGNGPIVPYALLPPYTCVTEHEV
jgi:hypothetical protein